MSVARSKVAEPYNLEVSLNTMIMGIDAQIGALENAGDSDTV